MTWKDLTLKERASIYKQARALSPDLTYFDIQDLFDSIPEKNNNVPTYSTGGIVDAPVATFGLPEVNIYPQNEFGDIARSQGINTARNWRTVKEGTTKGINDFYNDPRTQMVMAGLPMPSLLNVADDGVRLVKAAVDGSKITKKIKGLYYNNAPWTFKPNPNSYYRAIPREAIDDALKSGVIRGNPNTGPTPAEIANMSLMDKIKNAGSRAFSDQTYFTKGVPLSSNYGDRYNKVVSNYGTHLIEASEDVPFIPMKTKGRVDKDILNNLDKNYNPEIRGIAIPKANVLPEKTVPVNEYINLYEPDWFFGFKKVK